MQNDKNFRHEYKYLISYGQMQILQMRMDSILQRDSHVGENGMYSIRSLYFDDINDRCLYENINGVDPREKFRIRIYNHSSNRISLECKRKERGKTLKTSCPLSFEQTKILMAGDYIRDISNQPELLQKMTMEMMQRKLSPAIIVEYDRIPYVSQTGNVRITFDMNISSSGDVGDFFEPQISKRPVMPYGMHLLEVKWDEFLPDNIYSFLQLDSLQQTAFSKYALCRKYSI